MRLARLHARLAVLVGVCALAGCGRTGTDANAIRVTGTVTVGGKPLPLGMIVFEPDAAKGNRGPQGHANIKDGRFDTRQGGKAVVLGPQVVRITGGDGVNPGQFNPFGKLLFDEYSTQIELSKDNTDLTFDVPVSKAAPAGTTP